VFKSQKKRKDISMAKYVVFLRAVNVGGTGTINMSELKAALTDHGFKSVSSYINSGNIILGSDENTEKTRETIKHIIKQHFNLSVEMILKTQKELENILASDPYNADDY
jgi:uncharacterized protein (DUF1697 family)